MKTINKYLYNIFTAISISIILRIALINTYGDTLLENEPIVVNEISEEI